MAKYKLLTDIEDYRFTIPKGTIVEIQPMSYGGNTTNFYYQINTKYGLTGKTNFDIGSKDQPLFTIEKVSEETPITLDKNIKKKNVIKAIFKNDYSWKSGVSCGEGMIGCAPATINYKKGDSFTGMTLSLSSDKKQVISNMGNYRVTIPVENFTIMNDDGTILDITVADVNSDSNQNTGLASQTFLQKHKNHLLIAGALVIGYLAYKKFNK
jgi:hypothetical protein